MSTPRTKLLDLAQVCEATHLSKSTVYHGAKQGTFPSPRKALGKTVWIEAEVEACVKSLPAVYTDSDPTTYRAPRKR
jgi:predicted DNA-binding transcriptional regulator AlpA